VKDYLDQLGNQCFGPGFVVSNPFMNEMQDYLENEEIRDMG
jgi:hypothetical protein